MKVRFLTAVSTLLTLPAAYADWETNLRVGVTDISKEVYDLHMMVIWVCVAIGVIVFGAFLYALIYFRKSRGVTAAQFSHSTTAEIVWTSLPVVILIGMAIPAAQTLVKMEDSRETELSIKVTGYQWKWQYEYLESGVSFYSSLAETSNIARQLGSGIKPESVDNYLLEVDNPLVVPVGTKVRVLITASDVLHSWWVPDFAVKKDAIPGFINEAWFNANVTGTFRGQCAELCGKDHGFMPIVVEVMEKQDFENWIAEKVAASTTPTPEPTLVAAAE